MIIAQGCKRTAEDGRTTLNHELSFPHRFTMNTCMSKVLKIIDRWRFKVREHRQVFTQVPWAMPGIRLNPPSCIFEVWKPPPGSLSWYHHRLSRLQQCSSGACHRFHMLFQLTRATIYFQHLFSFEKIVNSTLSYSPADISLMSDIKKCTTGTAEMNHTIWWWD